MGTVASVSHRAQIIRSDHQGARHLRVLFGLPCKVVADQFEQIRMLLGIQEIGRLCVRPIRLVGDTEVAEFHTIPLHVFEEGPE
jgi:hypothetical protein